MDDRQQTSVAAKQRMTNFRFGPSTTPTSSETSVFSQPANSAAKAHARSHSRNNSISNASFKLSSMILSSDDIQDIPASPTPRSRPNSHHRRRSSVSTRRESAEIMGFAPPPEPTVDSDAEPAELRRLALRALEGNLDNPFIGGYSKVEIPELDKMEEVAKSKPTLASFGINSSLAGKRDSFGKHLLASNAMKDQLHTLMEEEEEEEEEEWQASKPASEAEEAKGVEKEDTPHPPLTPSNAGHDEPAEVRPAVAQPNRHRPSNLVLRPLSLTPNSLPLSRVTDSLPTPAMTPSPRITGLKTLHLASPASSISSMSSVTSSRRQSLSVSPSPRPIMPERRQSVGSYATPPQHRSSISYKRTDSEYNVHLLTPDATPTTAVPPLHAKLPSLPKNPSDVNVLPDLDRPLSPTEQAFLFRTHTSLLCRISELEAAIAEGRAHSPAGFCSRSRSPAHERFLSIASNSSISETESVSSTPSDELLQLVSDLKAERDELMRDVDGWRTRVSDLEKQISMLNRRVEAERREGWVVRERMGVLEVEKKRVREDLERERLENRRLEKALLTEETARKLAEDEREAASRVLCEEREKREFAEHEAQRLQAELAQLREQARRAEEYIPLGMRLDSDPEHDLPLSIRSDSVLGDDESDNELAHYEDDDGLDDDMIFGEEDQTSSSFSSVLHTNSHLLRLDLPTVAPAPAPVTPSHTRTGSMTRGWSFQRRQAQAKQSPTPKAPPEVDHFFECLDALDNETEDSDAFSGTSAVSTSTKLFWHGAMQETNDDDEDELPPFVLPAQPSLPKQKTWKEIEAAKLAAVAEEEEDEEEYLSPRSPSPLTTPKMKKRSVDMQSIPVFTLAPRPAGVPNVRTPPTPKQQRATSPVSEAIVPPGSSLSPKESYTGTASSTASSSITPPAKPQRSSISGSAPAPPSMIPRLSMSPRTPTQPPQTQILLTPPTPSRIPTMVMSPLKNRTPPPSLATTVSNAPNSKNSSMPMFIPQPKAASRPMPLLRA